MFDWLRRFVARSRHDDRKRLFDPIDALNVQAGGGEPIVAQEFLGTLPMRSSTLVLGDPQLMPAPSLEVPNILAGKVGISAKLWRYPSGMETVIGLELRLGNETGASYCETIGEVGIDSAKLVVADKVDIEEHWTEVGQDRIGVIPTAPDDAVLRLLKERFKLKTVRINPVRSEVVGPVSSALADEIDGYLKSIPKYAKYTFMYFHVQTNNSFERANFMNRAWDFMPIGDERHPLMFVCGTGRGDGVYDVQCELSGKVPRALSITFIEDLEE